jgi:hypothetical protein
MHKYDIRAVQSLLTKICDRLHTGPKINSDDKAHVYVTDKASIMHY